MGLRVTKHEGIFAMLDVGDVHQELGLPPARETSIFRLGFSLLYQNQNQPKGRKYIRETEEQGTKGNVCAIEQSNRRKLEHLKMLREI